MLEVANKGLHVAQMTSQAAMRLCFDAVAVNPARIEGTARPRLRRLPRWRAGPHITRSLPPSTGTWAAVVLANNGPHISAASSATSRLVTSVRSTLFFRYCSTVSP